MNFTYQDLKEFYKGLKKCLINKNLPLNSESTNLSYSTQTISKVKSSQDFGLCRQLNVKPIPDLLFKQFSNK